MPLSDHLSFFAVPIATHMVISHVNYKGNPYIFLPFRTNTGHSVMKIEFLQIFMDVMTGD